MFGFGKKRVLEDWLIMGCGFICENNRVYENILFGYMPNIDPDSEEAVAGKYLFRTFGANAAITGAGIQNKMNESTFDGFQMIIKMACLEGNSVLPDSKTLERMNKEPGFQIDKISIPMMLSGGVGAEFMDKTWKAFTEYCAGKEYASETLVDLYIQALSYPIKEIDKEDLSLKAMGMFAGLRNAVMKKV